jgi:hypothetical protein
MSWDLDKPLLKLGPNTYMSRRDLLEGLHIFGGIGSGKSSGSGKAIIEAVLRDGWGGIVCVAKHEEIERWISFAKKNGRERSLIIFDGSKGINFIQHELAVQGMGGLSNVVECIMRVLDMAAHATGSSRKESEPFWVESIKMALHHAIPVLYSAYGTVSVATILDFITSAATDSRLYFDEEWCEASFAGKTMVRVTKTPTVPMPPDTLRAMQDFWIAQWPANHDKTRANITVSISSKLDRFKHGRMRCCYCDKTDVLPEMTFGGAIILLAQPALTWHDDGIIGQQLFKYLWQRAVEMRNAQGRAASERPVFCYADESQYFANSYDDSFISTSRGSRAAMIYLSQNLPAYYARFGQEKADAVESLIGNFGTKVFHLSSCAKTNKFASELIGRGIHHRATTGRTEGTSRNRGLNEGENWGSGTSTNNGSSYGNAQASFNSGSGRSDNSGDSIGETVGSGSNEGRSWSTSENMDALVEPRFFASGELRCGGPKHRGLVDALWFKAGGAFPAACGNNYLRVTFKQ